MSPAKGPGEYEGPEPRPIKGGDEPPTNGQQAAAHPEAPGYNYDYLDKTKTAWERREPVTEASHAILNPAFYPRDTKPQALWNEAEKAGSEFPGGTLAQANIAQGETQGAPNEDDDEDTSGDAPTGDTPADTSEPDAPSEDTEDTPDTTPDADTGDTTPDSGDTDSGDTDTTPETAPADPAEQTGDEPAARSVPPSSRGRRRRNS